MSSNSFDRAPWSNPRAWGSQKAERDSGGLGSGWAADRLSTTTSLEDLRPIARALIHDLAQPLNTAACYAVAARNLAAKSPPDSGALCNALRGMDQQIQLAGLAMERLRELFRGEVEIAGSK